MSKHLSLKGEGPKQHQAPITPANSRTTNARLSQDGSRLLDESLNEGDGVTEHRENITFAASTCCAPSHRRRT
jgi:hypothetical protein